MAKAKRENISAIIVTYNSGQVIEACLKALQTANIKSIIIDNASNDDCIEIAKNYTKEIIINKKNQGFGRANNIGANHAKADWLLFINPDLVIENDGIDALISAANSYENIGILGPRIIEADGRLFLQSRSLLAPKVLNNAREIMPNGDCSVPFLSGACMMVRREIFQKIGGFDENIFLFYEDDDLCRKMNDNGFCNIFVNSAIAKHGRGKSSRTQKGQVFRVRYHLAWSKIYISRKYNLRINPVADLVKNGAKYALSLISFNQKRQERYGGFFFGTLDGMKNKSALKREGIIP